MSIEYRELAYLSMYLLPYEPASIIEEAGVPEGVVSCLTVSREEVQLVGTTLCHSPLLRKLSFTGSTAVGSWLMRECSSTIKKVR